MFTMFTIALRYVVIALRYVKRLKNCTQVRSNCTQVRSYSQSLFKVNIILGSPVVLAGSIV